jgi:crotonobetainyl-CoA:carnitine CoA-transferase CaiB-like acyl-CoA transferase
MGVRHFRNELMKSVLGQARVLDIGRFVAGPCCAAILGDLGAEVIRIEKLGGGEDRWLGPVGENGEGGMFLQNNRNKLSMTLEPRKPEGAEIMRRLIATADVVVANLPQGTLQEMGLSYPDLKQIKPDIILTSISAYGNGGPYSNRLGFDAVGQVMSGAVSRAGWPDQPVRTIVPYVDFSTALAAAVGTMAALMHRNATGEGQLVEAALLCTALMTTSAMLIEQDLIKPNRVATLNRGQLSAPNNIYAASDGFILIQVVGQPIFERWVKLLQEDHWRTDPRFHDDAARGENWEPIDQRMAQWCQERTKERALSELERARIPAYPVHTVQDALDDPHIAAMGYLKRTDYPGLPRPAPVVETPFRLSETPCEFRRRAPTLGEHTEEILRKLNYSDEQIAQLRERRVI